MEKGREGILGGESKVQKQQKKAERGHAPLPPPAVQKSEKGLKLSISRSVTTITASRRTENGRWTV